MTRRKKIILFSVLGIFGLGLLICGCLVTWGILSLRELPKARASGDSFMEQLATGQVDAAYDATAPAFRSSVPPEKFHELVAKYPAFINPTRRTMGGMRISQIFSGPRAFIQYNLSNTNNTLSLTLVLASVDGRWKVESVNLP